MRSFMHEIREADVGQLFHAMPNCGRMRFECWGRVLPADVGKRLYLVGEIRRGSAIINSGIVQMENAEQLARRLDCLEAERETS